MENCQSSIAKAGNNPLLPTSYWLLSILPAMSKIWGSTSKSSTEKYLGQEPYHKSQYGFRRSRSMVGPIIQVKKFVDFCKKKNLVCIQMAVDIKNVFNTLRWYTIIKEARQRKLPGNLLILYDYLKDREIIIKSINGKFKYNVYTIIMEFSARWTSQ